MFRALWPGSSRVQLLRPLGTASTGQSLWARVEAHAEAVGFAGAFLLVAGAFVVRAANSGSAELREAEPALACSYHVDEIDWDVQRRSHCGPQAEPRPHLCLPCYAGGASEGEETHRPRGGAPDDRITCSYTIESLHGCCTAGAAATSSTGRTTVLGQLGLRASDVARLQREGLLVLDGVLDHERLKTIAVELQDEERIQRRLRLNLNEASRQRASVDGDDELVAVRSDRTLFLGRQDTSMPGLPGLQHAKRILRSLGSCLAEEGFAGFGGKAAAASEASADAKAGGTATQPLCVPQETQLAVYGPTGTFYRPHRDGYTFSWAHGPLGWFQLRGLRLRAVTAILYLNDNGPGSAQPWRASDGGCLRVYLDQRALQSSSTAHEAHYVDIPPVGGRLVIFDAQKVLHEVRPNFRDRAALTVWFLASG